MLTRRERLILLNLVPGVGPLTLRRLLETFGDLEQLWQAKPEALRTVEGLTPRLAGRLLEGFRHERALTDELALAQRHGVRLVTREDDEYPERLRTIPDPPLVLYVRGAFTASDHIAIAMVGSRHASAYGVACAERLGIELAERGVTVVSGLARGIDAAAHRGALRARGRTCAVLGSGFAHLYPPEHARLAEEISAGGAVVSEYPLSTLPLPTHFPRRNRIISGLSLGVVIVEAAQRSGALITADCALEQGREVFAVPGPITTTTSQGTHQLLKQGARLVTSVDDILEELRLSPERASTTPASSARRDSATLSTNAQQVLACLRAEKPQHVDAIAATSGLPVGDVASALLTLELEQWVRQLPGKQFVRQPREDGGDGD